MIKFNGFRLDPDRRVLLGQSGAPVALSSPAFDILVCLIDGRDRVLSKTDIIACVWKGRIVSDNNLTVQMSSLRRTLSDQGGDNLITTVANVGYRFTGRVTEPDTVSETTSQPANILVTPNLPPSPILISEPMGVATAPARWSGTTARKALTVTLLSIVAASGVVAGTEAWQSWMAPAPPRLSIAVRPFNGMGLPAGQAFLAPAITEDLTTDIAHIPGSVVIARASADALTGRMMTPQRFGRTLGVRYIVAGTIEPATAGFRINAQLIQATNGQVLWTERFDTPIEALPDTQTTIVRRIASALDAELTRFEGARALRERPDNPDAEDLFYGGRSLLDHDDSMAGFTRAQQMLEEAVRRRPDFLDAQAQLGLTLLLKMRSHDDPAAQQDLHEARGAIAAALAAPRPSATAFAADARLREGDGDCSGADERAKAALALEPNSGDALAVLARCAANEGRLEEAANGEEQVLRLNPESGRKGRFFLLLSQIRLMQGRYSEAIDAARKAADATDRPQSTSDCMGRVEYAHILLISGTALEGDTAKAKQLYAYYEAHWPNRSAWRIGTYAARGFSALPGYHNFLSGLSRAGMPLYATEKPAASSPESACSEFMAVPRSVQGAEIIETIKLTALIAQGHPHVIDLGPGAAVILGADWIGDHPSGTSLLNLVGSSGDEHRDQQLVVVGSGVYGIDGYGGVRELVAAGYRSVYWYRGGEEAWSAAGLPAADRRSQY